MADPVAWHENQERQGTTGQGTTGQARPSLVMAKSTKRIALATDQPTALRLHWMRFSVIFLSCNANARVFDAKSGHGPHFPPPGVAASTKRLTNVA